VRLLRLHGRFSQADVQSAIEALHGNRRKLEADASSIGCASPVDHVLDVRRKKAVDDGRIFAHYGIAG